MAVLTPDQNAKLSSLLVNAFTQAELAPVVLVALKAPLANMVNMNQGFEGVVSDLVSWADRRNRPAVIALLQGVATARAGDAEIWAFCEEVFPGEIKRLDSGVLVDKVKDGIKALVALKDLPIVERTVGQFRADFEAVSEQIQILKKYKSLHDGLHHLQLKIGTIESEIEAAKSDQRAARSLGKHAIELAPLAREARQQAHGLRGEQVELGWISEFDDHIATMNRAPREPMSPEDLRDLASGLNQLLTEAPRINSLLANVASNLRLVNIVLAMDNIAKHIPGAADSNDAASQQISGDLTALGLLQPQLGDLVDQHFEWQWVDKELAGAAKLFRDALGPAAKMPKKKWPEFRARFMQLCDRHPQDSWSTDLKGRLLWWEQSPLSSPPTEDEAEASEIAFDEFRSACGMQFFEVDKELHALCSRLAALAQPLDLLLAVIRP